MQAPGPLAAAVIMISDGPGRKPRPHTVTSIEECDAIIRDVASAKTMIIAAQAALKPPAPPRDSHPYPAPDTAREPILTRCPDCRESELRCQCLSGEDATDYDGEHDDGPEPYPAADGVRCGAQDGNWHCTAQRGHGGPDHLAYAFGEIRHRWPVTAVRTGSIGPFPIMVAPPSLCRYCDIEPATTGDYCEACAPAVQLATGDGTRVVPEASRT